jgi:hypothetical protein
MSVELKYHNCASATEIQCNVALRRYHGRNLFGARAWESCGSSRLPGVVVFQYSLDVTAGVAGFRYLSVNPGQPTQPDESVALSRTDQLKRAVADW